MRDLKEFVIWIAQAFITVAILWVVIGLAGWATWQAVQRFT